MIGRALLAKTRGLGHRAIAAELGVPATTVRGWLRRLAERAELVRWHFTRLAGWLDPQAGPITPRGSPLGDAVESIGAAAVAAARGSAREWGRGSSPRAPLAAGCCATPARPSQCRGEPARLGGGRAADPLAVPESRKGAAVDDRRHAIALFRYSLVREAAARDRS